MGWASWRALSSTSVAGVMVPSRCRCNSALGRRRMNSSISRAIVSTHSGKFRPVAAIEEVDQQPGEEPDEESLPGQYLKAHHEDSAEDDAEHGKDGPEGSAERAMPLRSEERRVGKERR